MSKRDLFVVVPDLDTENAVKTLLCERCRSLGIALDFTPASPPQGDLLRYAGRDPGCYRKAAELLRAPQRTHRHALLIFDRHGCGAGDETRTEIETEVEQRIHNSGWSRGAVSVVAIEPELEAWAWADSPHVARVLGWGDDTHALRPFLEHAGLWEENAAKPNNPKEAMERALREKRKPLGARVFSDLASRVSLRDCEDPSFQKFRQTITKWFSA